MITATTVTAGNVGDGQAVEALLASELAETGDPGAPEEPEEPVSVYGDSAYGAGSVLDTLEQADVEIVCKVQPPNAPAGRYAKDAFGIDLNAGTVTCPAGQTAPLRPIKNGHIAHFRHACKTCPLAGRCTSSADGRSIHVGRYEQQLQRARARARQRTSHWKADYTSTRPKGRAEDQSSDATPARRTPCPRARQHEGHRRLLVAGCRGEPRTVRDARYLIPPRRMAGQYRLRRPGIRVNHPLKARHT